jgi:branched-chain amino acid transport system substrate-binding protein
LKEGKSEIPCGGWDEQNHDTKDVIDQKWRRIQMKSKFRQIALLLVLIMTLTLMVACGSGDGEATTSEKPDDSSSASTGEKAGLDEDNPIYLAWLSPLTGNYEEYGKTGVAACTLALEDINNSGGILGRKVVIDYFDDKADATESLNSANAIVDANKYVAVIGNYSSTGAMSAIPVFEENKIIYETPIASHADLAKMGQYIFRNGSVQSTESRLVADYMIEAGYKKMACIYMTDDFGLNTWKNWSDQFENVRGGEIVFT